MFGFRKPRALVEVDPLDVELVRLVTVPAGGWQPIDEYSLSESECTAIGLLAAAGVFSVRCEVVGEHTGVGVVIRMRCTCSGDSWKQEVLRSGYIRLDETVGKRAAATVNVSMVAWRLTRGGEQIHQRVIAGEKGELIHLAKRTGPYEGIRFDPNVRVEHAETVRPGSDSPQAIAAAQANASVGDIQNNIAVAGPEITIDNSGVADVLRELKGALAERRSDTENLPKVRRGKYAMVKTMLDERGSAPATDEALKEFVTGYNQKYGNKLRPGTSSDTWPTIDGLVLKAQIKDWKRESATKS